MNDDELMRKLNSVGKRVFIEQFQLFERLAGGKINRSKATDELVQLGISNDAGAKIRVGNAKLIFDAHRQVDAIDIVIGSTRMDASVMAQAIRLKKEIA